jgi:hypothetical protein
MLGSHFLVLVNLYTYIKLNGKGSLFETTIEQVCTWLNDKLFYIFCKQVEFIVSSEKIGPLEQ